MPAANTEKYLSCNVLVSVVIPTYNRAHIVTDSLESVHQQSYRPLELIVIDDGSTDNTAEVVQSWTEEIASDSTFQVHYIKQSNLGGNPARNRGIKAASGEFIAFLDSDDLWHSQKLEKQISCLVANPQMGGIYCGLRHRFIESGVVQKPSARTYPCGDLLHQMLIHDVTAPTSTYVLRAQVFDQVGGFDEQLLARQDWDMWIRLATCYSIGVVPEVLVDLRAHEGVRTASNPHNEMSAYRVIMEKYAELRSHAPFSVQQAAKASFYRRLGRVYFHHNLSKPRAFEYQLKAIANWPFSFDSYAALLGMLMPPTLRQSLHSAWNQIFGSTALAIRSH